MGKLREGQGEREVGGEVKGRPGVRENGGKLRQGEREVGGKREWGEVKAGGKGGREKEREGRGATLVSFPGPIQH